jgi:two-component system sensor histidine kinase QseC
MVEAELLFNERMLQHLDLLNYSLPDLLERGDIQNGHMRFPARTLASESSLEFQWLAADGRLLARSEGMPEAQVTDLRPGIRAVNFNHYRWQVLVARSTDNRSWFILAERDDQRYRMAESVILPAVYPMVAAVPLLGAIIWILLGIGLRPVGKLAQDVERREASDLRALTADDVPAELRPLASSANSLLRRLEASFARERRFSADAAHELRTPIAALKIQVDNLAYAMPAPAETLVKLQLGIERLSHLVEQILILNRVAPDQYLGRFEHVSLDASVRRSIAEHAESLSTKMLDIELLGSESTVWGDALALDSLLSNLISNAIRYTPNGGSIRVQTSSGPEGVTLDVIDSGVGIAPALRERVFDRFYRVDGDRHDPAVGGCGLGLSIVRQVADLHGARIILSDSTFASGLAVRVVFPPIDTHAKSASRDVPDAFV